MESYLVKSLNANFTKKKLRKNDKVQNFEKFSKSKKKKFFFSNFEPDGRLTFLVTQNCPKKFFFKISSSLYPLAVARMKKTVRKTQKSRET